MPLISPDVSGTAFPMLQYFDGVREIRTGVMRMGAGLQSDSINKLNSTATGASPDGIVCPRSSGTYCTYLCRDWPA